MVQETWSKNAFEAKLVSVEPMPFYGKGVLQAFDPPILLTPNQQYQ
jgi:hypothetical protein